MRAITKLLALAVLSSFALFALGCHTTEGFGKDMQAGGRRISHEAREHN
jgi:predicted small secreted protein